MKFTVEYKGQPIEVDIPEETLKMMAEDQKKKTGWERAEHGSTYWGVDNMPFESVEAECVPDDKRYERGNYFTSKELAENIARYQSLDLRIRRRIAEICKPVDWNDRDSYKCYIYYANVDQNLDIHGWYGNQYGGWCCDTKEHAEQIIDEFREELVWYFTEFKDRMDG